MHEAVNTTTDDARRRSKKSRKQSLALYGTLLGMNRGPFVCLDGLELVSYPLDRPIKKPGRE